MNRFFIAGPWASVSGSNSVVMAFVMGTPEWD
jgi:hypothetical protein